MEVRENGSEHILGSVSGVLIDPDSGIIEGFFITVLHFVGAAHLFLSRLDILRFGVHIYVQDDQVLAPAEDRIRLQALLSDERSFLGQRIVTESGRRIGRCIDMQFNTETMHVEWLFPKKFWRTVVALPVSEVLEVRIDAIVIRDQMPREQVQAKATTQDVPLDVVDVACPT